MTNTTTKTNSETKTMKTLSTDQTVTGQLDHTTGQSRPPAPQLDGYHVYVDRADCDEWWYKRSLAAELTLPRFVRLHCETGAWSTQSSKYINEPSLDWKAAIYARHGSGTGIGALRCHIAHS